MLRDEQTSPTNPITPPQPLATPTLVNTHHQIPNDHCVVLEVAPSIHISKQTHPFYRRNHHSPTNLSPSCTLFLRDIRRIVTHRHIHQRNDDPTEGENSLNTVTDLSHDDGEFESAEMEDISCAQPQPPRPPDIVPQTTHDHEQDDDTLEDSDEETQEDKDRQKLEEFRQTWHQRFTEESSWEEFCQSCTVFASETRHLAIQLSKPATTQLRNNSSETKTTKPPPRRAPIGRHPKQ